ncbi:CRISPR-associated endonuclease Cas2 [Candidatus Curtissbacteria bacterium]|nr:CRISPR-associated endonuclease Cas2 [Candidatus Curtissbacteria bacterium]
MVREKLRDAILLALEKAIDGAVEFADFYDNPRRYVWYGPRWEYPKSTLSAAIARLRKGGLVEKIIDEDRVVLKLTDAGRDWLLRNKLEDQMEHWDGVWRLVIFDIPERHTRVRDTLRRRLKEWGFNKWQKSVWASKKPLTDHLRKLVKELGIENWVLVVESTNTGL